MIIYLKNMHRDPTFAPNHPPNNPQENVIQLPRRNIGNYIINYGRIVGQGNFSTVYMAINVQQPNIRLVAKVINILKMKQQGIYNLVLNEIETLKFIFHDNLINCKEILNDQTWCYIITEYCQGGNLQTLIKNNGVLSQEAALPLIKNILDALIYLESNHLIHRDIKAANVFLKEGRAILADFGFAKFVNQPFLDLNIGSLPFMPPEAAKDSYYCSKTDVWTFGVFIYQIFHGQSPYAKSFTVPEMIQKMYIPLESYQFRPDLSEPIKNLILFCLQTDLQRRPHFTDIMKTESYKKLYLKRDDPKTQRKVLSKNSMRTFGEILKDKTSESQLNFKEVLLEIQQIRDYYKLSMVLKPRSNRMQKVKDRLLMRSARQIENVKKKMEKNLIDYGSENILMREKKLSNIIEEYEGQFQKQIKRRGINYEQAPKGLIVQTRLERTLEQDLNLIQEEELQYSSHHHDRYMESQFYRNKVKEIFEDIRSIERDKKIGKQI